MYANSANQISGPVNVDLLKKLKKHNERFQQAVWQKFEVLTDRKNVRQMGKRRPRVQKSPKVMRRHDDDEHSSFDDAMAPVKTLMNSKMYGDGRMRDMVRENFFDHLKNNTLDQFDLSQVPDRMKWYNQSDDPNEIDEIFRNADIWKRYPGSSDTQSSIESASHKDSSSKSDNSKKGTMREIEQFVKEKLIEEDEKGDDESDEDAHEEENEENENENEESEEENEENEDENEENSEDNALSEERMKATMTETAETRVETKERRESAAYFRRVKAYIEKCIIQISDISEKILDDDEPPDGSDDFQRRTKRTKEFASRFSRTYLYPFSRQLSILQTSQKPSENYRQFSWIFQMINRAFEVFIGQIPSIVGPSSYEKLKDYLKQVITFCHKVEDSFASVKMLEGQCYELINHIKEKFPPPVWSMPLKNKIKKTNDQHEVVKDRLSMYTQNTASLTNATKQSVQRGRKPSRAKDQQKVSKSKFRLKPINPKRRIRPIAPVPEVVGPKKLEKKMKPPRKVSLESLEPAEAKIETMIEYDNRKENDMTTNVELQGGNERNLDVLRKLLELAQTEKQQTCPSYAENLSTVIYHLKNFLQAQEEKQHLSRQKSHMTVTDSSQKKSYFEVNGETNARLIYMTGDSLLSEVTVEKLKTPIDTEAVNTQNSLIESDIVIETQQSDDEMQVDKPDKLVRPIKQLPKGSLIRIIEHKLNFYNYRKEITRMSMTNLKKHLTSIAEKLFDYGLMCIIKEMEDDEFLQNILISEFLY